MSLSDSVGTNYSTVHENLCVKNFDSEKLLGERSLKHLAKFHF